MTDYYAPPATSAAGRLIDFLANQAGWTVTTPPRAATLHGVAQSGFDIFGAVDCANLFALTTRKPTDSRFFMSRLAQIARRDVMALGCERAVGGLGWHPRITLALWSEQRAAWCDELTLWRDADLRFWLVRAAQLDLESSTGFLIGRHRFAAEPVPWADSEDYLRGLAHAQRFVINLLED